MIPEIIIAKLQENTSLHSVDRRILASLDTRQFVAKEN